MYLSLAMLLLPIEFILHNHFIYHVSLADAVGDTPYICDSSNKYEAYIYTSYGYMLSKKRKQYLAVSRNP